MGNVASIAAGSPKTLSSCLQAVNLSLRVIQYDSFASGSRALSELRKIAFDIAEIFSGCPDAEAQRMASAAWPSEFSLLKIALQSGLGDREKGFIGVVRELYQRGPHDPGFARHLILARLMLIPSHIDHPQSWDEIPKAYLENYVAYQLETLPLLLNGEGARDCLHREETLSRFYQFISSPYTNVADQNRLIALYLNGKNRFFYEMADVSLRNVSELVNRILRFIVRRGVPACTLDYEFQPRPQAGKIRIGVFSKTLMSGGETAGMLNNIRMLDRDKYHIMLLHADINTGYTSSIEHYRELIAAVDEVFHVVPEPIQQCLDGIRALNLDIIWHQTSVGITDGGPFALLFTYRLARIQIAMAAMCGRTTGNPYFQYFINMKRPAAPASMEAEFTETELNVSSICIYIPDNWHHKPNSIVTRKGLGIPEDAVVYFAGAAAAKYSPEWVETLAQIILSVPNSYLVLTPFNPAWHPGQETIMAIHALLEAWFGGIGGVYDRIKILPHVNGEAVVLMHEWQDIHLSSFPYGGVTTISESLRGGLCPVCTTCQCARHCGDASIMEGYGLEDMVVHSPQEYIQLAVRLGTDADFRRTTKARVKEAYKKRHPLLKSEIAASYADVIEKIVEREFNC